MVVPVEERVVVEGIGCSFGSGIDLVVVEGVDYQEAGCSVVEYLMQCFAECLQEFLGAYPVAAFLAAAEQLRQRQPQNHDRRWLLHRLGSVIPLPRNYLP